MAFKNVVVVVVLVTVVSMVIAQAPEEGTSTPTTISPLGGLAPGPAYYNPAQESRDRLVTFLLFKSMMGGADGEGGGMMHTMLMLRAFGFLS
ncbi:Hypothetical predicted protein [Mytilus galloprovincialis]|uniref:Uncharacterized protein n=1 Tax=Mytilus galloprovincialis TaxID=29158 RepID=A0A8B6FS51_MYTGA|nr:Hypothetical predicted protein [Mytilus galloprovincialis]